MIFHKNIIAVLILLSFNNNCKTTASSVDIDVKTKIRYIEMYESVCCPRDYKHDNHLLKYIKNFETKNKVSLKSNYKLPLGKEGEAAYFLSLENLTSNQRKKFINERLKAIKPSDKSVINHLNNPISIKESLEPWENYSINNLIKI